MNTLYLSLHFITNNHNIGKTADLSLAQMVITDTIQKGDMPQVFAEKGRLFAECYIESC